MRVKRQAGLTNDSRLISRRDEDDVFVHRPLVNSLFGAVKNCTGELHVTKSVEVEKNQPSFARKTKT